MGLPNPKPDPARQAIASALRTLATEREGLSALIEAIGNGLGSPFAAAVARIAAAQGRVIVTGIGKSGHVARKIAATFASTGTPSHYVHPAEASHGDLGMVRPEDVIIALSWSGETTELALGDALAIALLERRGFPADHFRVFHPGGKLGAQLKHVRDIMHTGERLPIVALGTRMAEALVVQSEKSFGCTIVVDRQGDLAGIITDGDIRRHMSGDLLSRTVEEVMTPDPLTVAPDMLVAEALDLIETRKKGALIVADGGRPMGLVHVLDLLRIGAA